MKMQRTKSVFLAGPAAMLGHPAGQSASVLGHSVSRRARSTTAAVPGHWARLLRLTSGAPCGAYQNYRKLFTDPILWVLLAFQLLFISQTVTDVFQKKFQGIYKNLTFYFFARHPIYWLPLHVKAASDVWNKIRATKERKICNYTYCKNNLTYDKAGNYCNLMQ